MTPLNLFDAVIAVIDGFGHVAGRRGVQGRRRGRSRFAWFYVLFLVVGLGVLAWVVYSLYFK